MRNSITHQQVEWAVRLLDHAGDIPVAMAIRALWLPLAQELSRSGSTFDDGRVGQLLRQHIRTALLDEIDVPVCRWVMPMTATDLTATHLAALILTRCGVGSRVWPWWPMPAPGPSILVGDGDRIPADQIRITIQEQHQGWPALVALAE